MRSAAKIFHRIDGRGAFADFEMELRRLDVPGRPDPCDGLPAFHLIALLDRQRLIMRIGRHPAIGMADQHHIAETAQLVTGIGNDAIRRMYEQGLAGAKMTPSPGRLVIDGDTVAVEIDLEVDGAPVRLGDFFTIRSGRIQQLSIYSLTPNGGRLLEKVGVDPQNHNPGDS